MNFTMPSELPAPTLSFLIQELGAVENVVKAAGDASFRSYFRVFSPGGSRILMNAPPGREDPRPFLDIARFLKRCGVPVPRVFAADLEHGLVLLEDFGDTTYLKAVEAGESAEEIYYLALEQLVALQATPNDGGCIAHSRPYDHKLLRFELSLFTDWFIERVIGRVITPGDREGFEQGFAVLIAGCLAQPTRLVHRDYHSRNLMWHQGGVGIIDFQDAVMGPITYDLASLLRDCYVAWDGEFRRRMLERWLQLARERLAYSPEWAEFERDFDWMAIQRNLKAVGIFGRLSRRDGKHGYLNDIPRTMGYVWSNLERYPELSGLREVIARYVPRGWEPNG